MKKKLKIILEKLKLFFIKYNYIIFLSLPFIAMDLIIRIYSKNINFYPTFSNVPNLFSICWITFFVAITCLLNHKIGKFFYLSANIIYLIVLTTNLVYYNMTSSFFDFNLLQSAGEASPYILDSIANCNIWVYISIIIVIGLIVVGFISIPKKKKTNSLFICITFLLFILLHNSIPLLLGKEDKELTWSTWRNPKNIYLLFNDNDKSLKISGFFEYTFRNFFITYIKTESEITDDELEFLDNAFIEKTNKNKYTGIYKDKNLILLQLEGIDNWLITKEDTPTLYNMKNNSFNFNNHYSFYNGGGSTFNSEFAVNAGYITPFSFTKNAYSFNKNSYPNSLPHMFKNLGYVANAFHMNSGQYYSRTSNYKNWGYDNYYGLIDMFTYDDQMNKLDRELLLNEEYSNFMFSENNFVNYIITYSTHLPFNNTNKNSVCKLLYDLDNIDIDVEETREPVILTEEECARRQAKETDYMVELLLNKLEEKGLLDNTVIAVFTDHYLYTLEDKTILDKYKDTSNNLINKTPFFIWSKNQKKVNINTVTSQLNILPTLLNLFGVKYNVNNYIGDDALNTKYNDVAIFSDYSWYDGNVYVQDGIVTNNKKINNDLLEQKNYYVSYITKKNDLTLKYNYFK